MANSKVLILPGWQNSGPAHWQSRWETLNGDLRVEQHDWMRPLRGDWIARLEEVLLDQPEPVLLAAHSLGCQLVAGWASITRNAARVKAVLLVAPGDPDTEIGQSNFPSFSPVVMQPLPFPSVLVASHNDPFTRFERAQAFAAAWGSRLVDLGACGHINADSGLGDWPQGRALLAQLDQGAPAPSNSI